MRSFLGSTSTLRTLLIASLIASLGLLIACERSPEDLEDWRTAQNGMAQLSEWAADEGEPTDVRKRAIEIMLEEGEVDYVPRTLNEVEEDDDRQMLAAAAMSTIERLWDEQDVPELTEEDREGLEEGQDVEVEIPPQGFDAANAVDAIYRTWDHFDEDAQQRGSEILRDWISQDQELRTQLASTGIAYLVQYAGESAVDEIENWLMETDEPYALARTLRPNVTEEQQLRVDEVIAQRAKEEHPDLDDEMRQAVVHAETDGMVPYLSKMIDDEVEGMSEAFQALANIGGDGHAKLLELVEERTGTIRWTAASRLLESEGIDKLADIANLLPEDEDGYDLGEDHSLDDFTRAICADAKRSSETGAIEAAADTFSAMLDEEHWPSTVLALQCAQIFGTSELRDRIQQMEDDDTELANMETVNTVGDLATVTDTIIEDDDE